MGPLKWDPGRPARGLKPEDFACLAGYRVGEVNIETIVDPREGTRWKHKVPITLYDDRTVAASSLGCHIVGACPIKPDLKDHMNVMAAIFHRMTRKPIHEEGTPNDVQIKQLERKAALCELRNFIESNFDKHFQRCQPEDILDFETWLSQTNYTEVDKRKFRELRACLDDPEHPRHKEVKSFLKDEAYTEFKNPRAINSRTDSLKVVFGPICKMMENVTYKNPAFIKHVPVPERPAYIERVLGMAVHLSVIDYTSYEASFDKDAMENIEFVHYRLMLAPVAHQIARDLKLFYDTLVSPMKLVWHLVTLFMVSIRASGEMNTSLGNGVSNFWKILYMCYKSQVKMLGFVVEGDDNECNTSGPLNPAVATTLGFRIKLSHVKEYSDASFCGLIFDPKEMLIVTDVRKQLLNFGWTDRKYSRSNARTRLLLLRAKAYSMLYQYPGCPILHALATRALYLTRSYDVDSFIAQNKNIDSYTRELLLRAIRYKGTVVGPGPETRLLLEKRFDISVETQLMCEEYFENWDGGPMDLPLAFSLDSEHMYFEYFIHDSSNVTDVPIAVHRSIQEWMRT